MMWFGERDNLEIHMLRVLGHLLALRVRQIFFSFILCIGMIISNNSSLIYMNI